MTQARDARGRFVSRAQDDVCIECGKRNPVKTPYCDRPPFGWKCNLPRGHRGSCPARPRWWNLLGLWAMRGIG